MKNTKLPQNAKNTKKFQAFTLIELLVVIAIIAILAAILFPVFARARENARRASCLSNQKQIGLGFLQYIQDYDERFPRHDNTSPGFWGVRIMPYVKSNQLFFCPSDTTPTHNSANPISTANVSYGYNYAYFSVFTTSPTHISAIAKPSQTLLTGDTGANTTGYVIYWTGTTYLPRDQHLDGATFLFADGHTKWMKAATVIATKGTAEDLWDLN